MVATNDTLLFESVCKSAYGSLCVQQLRFVPHWLTSRHKDRQHFHPLTIVGSLKGKPVSIRNSNSILSQCCAVANSKSDCIIANFVHLSHLTQLQLTVACNFLSLTILTSVR